MQKGENKKQDCWLPYDLRFILKKKKKTIFLFSIYKKPQAHYHIPFQVQGICRAIGEQHFWMHGIPFVAQLYSDGITSRPLKDS